MSFDDTQNNVIYGGNGNYKVTAYGDVIFGEDENDRYSLNDGLIEMGMDGRPSEPVLVLSSRGGHKIGAIQNVRSINRTHPLSDVAELSFDVYKEINGETYKDWDKIKDFKFIQMPHDNTWFEAKVTLDEENDIIKHVTCLHANEAELGQLNLYDVEINTDADIERDDYVETFFYNEDNPKASLLHRILKDKAPHYQIYHVDDSLKGLWRSFSFSGTSIQDALNQIAEEVGCLFVYGEWAENDGKYHRTISAYDLEDYCYHCGKRGNYTEHVCTNCGSDNINYGYGEDTGIFISKENLATSINYESNTDEVKNCFRLVAGDDVMTAAIKSCNPSMSQYMWYFSEDMLEDMSDELREKITAYQKLVNDYQTTAPINIDKTYIDTHNSLVDKYSSYNDELVKIDYPITGTTKLTEAYYNAVNLYGFIKSELMPSSEKVESTTAIEQLEILQADGNMSEVGISSVSGTIPYTSANSAIQSYAKVYIDTSRYNVTVFTDDIVGTEWTGTITLQSYTDDEDTASDTFTITLFDGTDNAKYTEWIHQSVQKAMANREVTDLSVTNLFKKDESVESFKEKIKSYSLDYLDIMNDMATSAITIMTEQGIANEDSLDTDVYTQLYKPYLDKSRAIQAEIGIKEEELSKLQRPIDEDGNTDPRYPNLGLLDIIANTQNELAKNLDIQTYLGEDLWTELSFYRRENEYQNANYISDGLTDSEIIEQAQRFVESATKEIIKSATLQHTISAPLIDFLIMPEFMKLQKKFKTGNWIRLKVDDKVYKLRLTNWTVDFDDIEDLDVEFSDVIRVGNTVSDIASILSKSRSMATTYDYTAKQANKGKDANDTIKVYRDYGIDFRKIKAITSKGNTNIVYDDDGILLKRVDGTETLPEQARIYNNGIYITKDAWETVSTGLGHYSYVDPETGETVQTYGIIADTVIGKLILGENLKIYSQSGKFEMGDDGLKITAKDGEDNSDLFVVQKEKTDEQGRKYVEKYIYVDSNGEVKITGSSITLGGKPLVEYIDDAIDDIEEGISPTVKSIVSSHVTAVCEKDGTYNPTSILFSGKAQHEETITDYYGWFVVEISPDGTNWVKSYETDASKSESSINYKIPLGVTITKDGVVYSYNETNVTTNGSVVDSAFTISPDGVITTSKDIGFIIRSIRCTLYSSADKKETEVVDQQRVSIVFDGVDGESGDDGYTVVLTNENHTFSGNTTSAVKASTECEVVAYIGKERVACHIGDITGHPNGMQTEIINNDTNVAKFKVSVDTSMTSQNGVLHIPVTVDDKFFDMIFTYSLKLNGLDATGLGWKVNYSSLTTENNGECYYHGFDEVTKEPSDKTGVKAWVLWNGEEVEIPMGCYVNPDQTMPFNNTIYSVYRLSETGGTFHDVSLVEVNGKYVWRYNTYTDSKASMGEGAWNWNEGTDIILGMYEEPSNEGAIINAQLFTPPKKYSELVEPVKEMAKDAEKVANYYMKSEPSMGSMFANMTDGIERLPSNIPSGYKNILIKDDVLQVRDGQDVLASYGETTTIGKESGNHVKINQYGVDIKDGEDSLASYGETVRVGQETLPHLELGSGGMIAYKNKTDKYYEIGDGSTDATQRYIVSELPLILNLTHPVESVTSVSIDGTVLNADQYEWASDDQEITILDRPVGAIKKIEVTYTYTTSEEGEETSEEDEQTSEEDEQTVTSTTDTFENIDAAPSLEIEMDYRITSDGNVTVSQVLIDDVVSDKYTVDTTVLEINERPTSGSTVTIQYHFKEQSPYFTFNKRKNGVDKGNSSASFGNESSASGDSSFATGIETSASGHGSFVGGNKSVASGAFSGAIGEGTTASGIGSFACGRYNVKSSTHLFSVGNGTEQSPSDAFYVSAGGDATLYGDLQAKGRALIHGQMRGGVKNGGYIAMFSTKSFYKTVGSVPANGSSTGITLNITRNGYYPMSVSGIRILNKSGGSNASRCNVYIYKIVNNTNESHITFSIANLGSANATGVKVEFTVFYIARNAVLGE